MASRVWNRSNLYADFAKDAASRGCLKFPNNFLYLPCRMIARGDMENIVLEANRMAKLNVNGKTVEFDADGSTPLLWVLREHLELTGTKYGCGVAVCGACTVHVNGAAQRSCVLPLETLAETDKIVTIEGLSADGSHPVQKAWAELDVPQCGYCQPGMIMASAALLAENPKPSDEDIDASITNICRCGTYRRVRAGIHRAAGQKA
jgi:isoquinoline 1-oxidoreductase alpha subunit